MQEMHHGSHAYATEQCHATSHKYSQSEVQYGNHFSTLSTTEQSTFTLCQTGKFGIHCVKQHADKI